MALDATELRIVVVTGVAGSGKTTIGKALADRLGVEFQDADDFHGAANIAKMARGEALTDADRNGWLTRLRARIDRALTEGTSVVLACSALKKSYRRQLGIERPELSLVYLRVTPELAARRMSARSDHFMPRSLVTSQFSDLEEPVGQSGRRPAPAHLTGAIVIDADQPIGAIVSQIAAALEKR